MTTQPDWKSTKDWKNDVMVGVIVQLVSNAIEVEVLSRVDDRTASPADYLYYLQISRKWQEHAADGKFADRLKTDPKGLRKDVSVDRDHEYALSALSWCLGQIQRDTEEQWEWGERVAQTLGLDSNDPDVAAEVYMQSIYVMKSIRDRLDGNESDEET